MATNQLIDGYRWIVVYLLHNRRFQYLIDLFFCIHCQLDPTCDLRLAGEQRCMQCNEFFLSDKDRQTHVESTHTYPVRQSTRNYARALENVRQSFQEGLPRVYLHGAPLANRYKAKWVGLTLTADGDEQSHVRSCLLSAEILFGQHRKTLGRGRNLLSRSIKH